MISALQSSGILHGSPSPTPSASSVRSPQRRSLRLELARRLISKGSPEPRALRALEYLLVELFSQTHHGGRYRVLLPEEQVDQLITWLLQDAAAPGPAPEVKEYLALMEETLRQPNLEQLVNARLLERIRQVKYNLGMGYFSRGAFKAAVQSLILLERVIGEPGFAPLDALSGEGLLRLPIEARVTPVMQRAPRRLPQGGGKSGVVVTSGLVLPPRAEPTAAGGQPSTARERSVIVLPPPTSVWPGAETAGPAVASSGEGPSHPLGPAPFVKPASSGLVLPPISRASHLPREQSGVSVSMAQRAAAHQTANSTSSRAPGTRPLTPGTWAKAQQQGLSLPPPQSPFMSNSTTITVSGEWKHTLPPRSLWAGAFDDAAEAPEPEGLRRSTGGVGQDLDKTGMGGQKGASTQKGAPTASTQKGAPGASTQKGAPTTSAQPSRGKTGKSGPSERERRRLLSNVLEDLELVLNDPEALSEDTLTGKNLRALETLNRKLEQAQQTGSRAVPEVPAMSAPGGAPQVPAMSANQGVRRTQGTRSSIDAEPLEENPFSLLEPSRVYSVEGWGHVEQAVSGMSSELGPLSDRPPEVPDPARNLNGHELLPPQVPDPSQGLRADALVHPELSDMLKLSLDIPLDTGFVRRFDHHENGHGSQPSLVQGDASARREVESAAGALVPLKTPPEPPRVGGLKLDMNGPPISDEQRNELWRMSVPELELEDPHAAEQKAAQATAIKKRASQIRGKVMEGSRLQPSEETTVERTRTETEEESSAAEQSTRLTVGERPSRSEEVKGVSAEKRFLAPAPWDGADGNGGRVQGRLEQLKQVSQQLLSRLSQPVKVGKGSLTMPLPPKQERMMPTLRSLKTGSTLTPKAPGGEGLQQWARGRTPSAQTRSAELAKGNDKAGLRATAAVSPASAPKAPVLAGSTSKGAAVTPSRVARSENTERRDPQAHAEASFVSFVPSQAVRRMVNVLTVGSLIITGYVGSSQLLEPPRSFEFPSSTYQAYQIDAMAGKLPLAGARRYGGMLLISASPEWLKSTPEQHTSMVSHLITHTFGREGVERVVILDPSGRILADVDRDDLKITVGQR